MNVRMVLDEIERERRDRAYSLKQLRVKQLQGHGDVSDECAAHERAILRLDRWKAKLIKAAREEGEKCTKKQKAA